MPPKKIKKAAKKLAKKSDHYASHDLRRAYEHLGRVDILEGALAGMHFRNVSALTTLAQQQIANGHIRDAADLLRAAEHICFAALAPEERAGTALLVSADLQASIYAELSRLTARAEELWMDAEGDLPHEVLSAIFSASLDEARLAYGRGAYRPSLELARAAEALAHVSNRPSLALLGSPAHRMAS